MNEITYEYIDYKSTKFEEVTDLRFEVLFKPYNKIEKYDYDELDGISFHLVASYKGSVIGYCRMTKFNENGKITNVVVNPSYIKKRIGFKMLKKQIIKAEECNINYLYLNARLDTVDFYKKVGFECTEKSFLSEKSGLKLQEMNYKII